MKKWQSREGLKELTIALVEYGSVTGSEEEVGIVEFVDHELRSLPYFQDNGDHIQTYHTEDGRKFVTSLVKSTKNTDKTVIVSGHLDVVDVEDYGDWKHLAFRPREFTKQMEEQYDLLPKAVQNDLNSGEWLFGRGVMDMKAGIALCMSLVEAAAYGEFDGNILFLGVPDEEVNSTGMRAAVPVLLELKEKYHLKYELVWNTEPMFAKFPGDDHLYVYQGSLGKMLPGFYCMGEEAHVAEPFSGLNGNFMASYITRLIELNPDLSETVENEKTPPPSNLLQKDLKVDYSVQIPHKAVSVFNLFTMKKSSEEITNQLLHLAKKAAEQITIEYRAKEAAFVDSPGYSVKERKITVLSYQELWEYALKKVGNEELNRRLSRVLATVSGDDREKSYQIVNEISTICKELAPMIVLYYSPPYYPAVCSASNELIKGLSEELEKLTNEVMKEELTVIKYFPGLSDLSYLSLTEGTSGLSPLTKSMPLWEISYDIPLEEIEELNVAVMNFGPVGKDPHRWTERLNISKSFTDIPKIVKLGIRYIFSN
ncbi:M20/M25/M40 family metallo-hydrolase [Evansella tamaricis]|uniref:M20/M25/M40 family metallo-hydrolase n=1 Tax=Evansella tamaricis TaxID=2069301 RepID=A0ABS6JM27_9BACI|nr:M20/M25/M40 family metallo-hydrolase [Evansella tamaricis]